jgi:hypothetical protein
LQPSIAHPSTAGARKELRIEELVEAEDFFAQGDAGLYEGGPARSTAGLSVEVETPRIPAEVLRAQADRRERYTRVVKRLMAALAVFCVVLGSRALLEADAPEGATNVDDATGAAVAPPPAEPPAEASQIERASSGRKATTTRSALPASTPHVDPGAAALGDAAERTAPSHRTTARRAAQKPRKRGNSPPKRAPKAERSVLRTRLLPSRTAAPAHALSMTQGYKPPTARFAD